MAAQRQALTREAAADAAARVVEVVVGEPRVAHAPRVALYAASGGELPTRPLFRALRDRGVRLLLPRVRASDLEWAVVASWSELEPGRFGIRAPSGEAVTPPGAGDVVFCPGLAFDRAGGRLGRGAGYYDRAFPSGQAGPWLFGLCYAFQLVDHVPRDSHDRRVDAIVTPLGWSWPGEAG